MSAEGKEAHIWRSRRKAVLAKRTVRGEVGNSGFREWGSGSRKMGGKTEARDDLGHASYMPKSRKDFVGSSWGFMKPLFWILMEMGIIIQVTAEICSVLHKK